MSAILLILAGVFGTVQYQDHQAIKQYQATTEQRFISVEDGLLQHETKLVYLYKNKAPYKPSSGVSNGIPNGNPFENIN